MRSFVLKTLKKYEQTIDSFGSQSISENLFQFPPCQLFTDTSFYFIFPTKETNVCSRKNTKELHKFLNH